MQEENKYATNIKHYKMTRLSKRFIRVSEGYADVPNLTGIPCRHYCEVWLATATMQLQVKVKIPAGSSYSYYAGKHDLLGTTGGFLCYWVPKNVYFPVHFCGTGINDLVDVVVKHLRLKVFKESRKWLTPHEKNVAELVAFVGISDSEIENLLECDISDIPQAFWDYTKELNKEYCNHLRGKKMLHDQLNTPAGLERMLGWLRNNPIPSGLAVSSIEHYLLQQGLLSPGVP